jgi:hypothetical protein
MMEEKNVPPPSSNILLLKDCPVKRVTVYCDRAEVTREFSFTPNQQGSVLISVSGLTEYADKDSIRVKLVRLSPSSAPAEQNDTKNSSDKCPVVIEEVSFDINYRTKDATAMGAKEAKANAILEECKNRKAALEAEKARVQQQDQLVNGYLRSMLMPTCSGNSPTAGVAPPIGADLDAVGRLLEFHSKQSTSLDHKLADIERALGEVEAKAAAGFMFVTRIVGRNHL